MSGKLAVDFGTSNTIIALWDENRHEGVPFFIPEYCFTYHQDEEAIPVIPSIIHYAPNNVRWIGNQVLTRGLYHSRHTFRWMKRYISQRSPIKIQAGGREITPIIAGNEFLSTIILLTVQENGLQGQEIGLSVPVESFEHYENWLSSVADTAGMPRFRLIDEPSAAALGYGAHIQPGNIYLIFDFGGGTMHASVILMEEEPSKQSGRRCRVLGKAGKFIGGSTIDQWIFQEVLRINQRQDYDESIRLVSNQLLVACEQAKEKLSGSDQVEISLPGLKSEATLTADISRTQFEELLDRHNLFQDIHHLIRSALNSARERGYSEDHIQKVLLVGGSSSIPAVQRTLRQLFGKERVLFNRPLDAVARGAAAFVAGVDFYDYIQHNYAIRYINSTTHQYDYRIIVPRGTQYPTQNAIARLAIKASYDGQNQLGLAIFEQAETQKVAAVASVEIVFDPTGAARIVQVAPGEEEQRSLYWMNEANPTFLAAQPPGKKGEPRFEVEFGVDANKRLVITARDLSTGQLTHHNYPVVKLV